MTIFYDIHHFNRTLGSLWWHGRCLMTIFKDSHHFSRTLGDVWWQSLRTAITSVELWAMFENTTTKNTTTTTTTTTTTKTPVFNVRHTRSDERVAMSKMSILPQFWASDTSEVTRGSPGSAEELRFTTVLSVRHARSDERVDRRRDKFACVLPQFWTSDTSEVTKGRSATWKICVLPQFWTSDTHEVTKGSPRYVKSLRFTTVLSVRHARSDERVVKSTGAIPAPRQKKNIF